MVLVGLVLGVAMSGLFAGDEPAQEFVFTAEKLEKAAVIDGVQGKDEYPVAVMEMKQTPDRYAVYGTPAQARVFHNGKSLYVSVTVPFTDGTALSKGKYWSQDDGAEVCFRAVSGTVTGSTFVIHGFAGGDFECVDLAGAGAEKVEQLEKGVKYSAKINEASWTGEWEISLESAGIKYEPGMKLDFNVGVWRSASYEWIIWRGANGATYELDKAGKLILK